jgi:hypothetical protein
VQILVGHGEAISPRLQTPVARGEQKNKKTD